jgi:CRP-like cAMP-binding protein
VRHLIDGNAIPLYLAHNNETFAEAALFSEVYHCDAIAEIDSEIEVHPKKALLDAFTTNADIATAFMAHLSRQVISLRSRLEICNIRSAEERVMQFLKLEASTADNIIIFASPLKDIAASIGLSHEAFYRVLSKLAGEEKIVRDGRTITLLGR